MGADIKQMQVEVRSNLEFQGEQFFTGADRVVSATPSGYLNGSRHDICYGADEQIAPRILVQDGMSGGILPFRGIYRSVGNGKLVDRFPAKTVDVAVFDRSSSRREYGRAVYDHFGPVPLPFFEARVKRVLRKAEKQVGKLATALANEA